MSSMMHYSPRCLGGPGCCGVQGSRMAEREALRQEIEMELNNEQTEERYMHDEEDRSDENIERWEDWLATPLTEREKRLMAEMERALDDLR